MTAAIVVTAAASAPSAPAAPAPAPEAVAASPAPLPLDPAAFAEAHRALRADRSIQFELTRFELEAGEMPAWLRCLLDFFSTEHPYIRTGLWILAALFAIAILALLATKLRGKKWPWRRAAEAEGAAEAWRPEPARARHLLGEADALAAAGRYSEAAHLLLHRSIADVDERRPDLIRKSLTSRDIAALSAIPDRPRSAFAEIALLVERSLFGRRVLAEPDWRECRTAYERFAFALSGEALAQPGEAW